MTQNSASGPGTARDAALLLELSDRHHQDPYNAVVAAALAERSEAMPWYGGVPAAGAVSMQVMAEYLRDYPQGSDSPLQVAPSWLEPPSAVLAFHTAFPNAQFLPPPNIGEPDPRLPLHPAEPVVWRYEGTTPYPAVAPPSPDAAERLRALATEHWSNIPAVYRLAAPLAEVPLPDLYGALVHPPASPTGADLAAGWRPDRWIRAVQVMACLGIAHHRDARPWRESPGAPVLLGLSLGPEDWITEAACFALVAAAWTDPLARPDAGTAVAVRWVHAAKAATTRGVSVLESLTRLVLACPWLDERVLERAEDMLAQLEGARG